MKTLKISEISNPLFFEKVKKESDELIVRFQLLNKIYKRDTKTDRKLIIKDISDLIKNMKYHINDIAFAVLVEKRNPNDLKLKSLLKKGIIELSQHNDHNEKQLQDIEPKLTENDWESIKRELLK